MFIFSFLKYLKSTNYQRIIYSFYLLCVIISVNVRQTSGISCSVEDYCTALIIKTSHSKSVHSSVVICSIRASCAGRKSTNSGHWVCRRSSLI